MDIVAFTALVILFLIILTLILGVLSYFAFKARGAKSGKESITYEEVLLESGKKYIFFERKNL
ncbi:hypothetical protein [Desulfurobacterium sp.]